MRMSENELRAVIVHVYNHNVILNKSLSDIKSKGVFNQCMNSVNILLYKEIQKHICLLGLF